ncbi:spermatogenesis-associated protein 24 isoform X1 [Tachyglossus aculeatus]|uniref:spermatogenesis-associated protein 24 isoform X1 n=1 Tax=Tachyglossus aculeatus TaxID=9261 RepID=UPI0018F53321|nr:spermatogenesis-associated protein 24 isoform X1 [Tachyglossus aculeatus]
MPVSTQSIRVQAPPALAQMAIQEVKTVSKDDYDTVVKKLEAEKAEHAKTKSRLAKESEKLQFALGEVEVLARQLEREKEAFEKALSGVQSKVLKESSQKDKLLTKCTEIESRIHKQEGILHVRENEIKELHRIITQQKHSFRTQVSDLRIQKQQERYITQALEKKKKKKKAGTGSKGQ